MLEEEYWVGVTDRRLDHSLGVLGRSRIGNLDPGGVQERRFGILGVERPAPHVSARRAANDDRAVRISVKDSGAGIPEKDLPRVFDRFWQADPASKAGGAGLGLSICRGIVEAHGGRIWAAGKVDRGTTLHFTVPLADS